MGYECQSKNGVVPPAPAGIEEPMHEFCSFFPSSSHLTLTGDAQATWHESAAATTRAEFGREIFVRAVVEVSNFCRENCAYCGMRRDNRSLHRFRAHHEQLAELLVHHRPASVTDVNIQAGEDPVA